MPPRRKPLEDTSGNLTMSSSTGTKRSRDKAGLTDDSERAAKQNEPPHTQSSQAIDLTQDDTEDKNAGPDDEDDGGNEIMFMTQADAQNSDSYELYGTMISKVVGIRYYNGFAGNGEAVILRREPHNQYDSNAIQVLNVRGNQVGHVPRQLAAKLTKYVDPRDLLIEGTLAGSRGEFDIPMRIQMYGPSNLEQKEHIKSKMSSDRLDLGELKLRDKEARAKRAAELKKAAAQKKSDKSKDKMQWSADSKGPGDGDKKQPDIDEIAGDSQVVNPREVGKIAESFGAQEEELADMPTMDQPSRMLTQMLPYQKQGLAWLLEKESPELPKKDTKEVVQLWKRKSKQNGFTNIATNFSQKEEPQLARGGILADDMGLGKTLELIGLVIEDQNRNGYQGPTLIVCPLSVMSNWSGQIERHVDPKKPLRVYTYHGTGRKTMKPEEFAEYDVVITTYGTLSVEYLPKGKDKPPKTPRAKGLYGCEWRRIVLDEGHNIRNPNTKNALAACAVQSYAKWALTGTPIINTLKDLYSLIRFIGLTGGLKRLEIFNTVLMRPMKEGHKDAHLLLQALMNTFCLRRRKDMSFVDLKLPELTEYVHRIKFADHEQKKYKALEDEAKGVLKTYQNASGTKAQQTYRHLLEILLRLRQVCNHWKMCEDRITNLMAALENSKSVDLTPENRRALQDLLQLSIESQEDCPICLENLHNPVITNCGHAFGNECITRVIETQQKCPMCRAALNDDSVLVQPRVEYGDDESDPSISADGSESTKTAALMSIVAATHKKSGSKIVIFSQWCRFLDLIQPQLEAAGYGIARLDGSMSATKRDASLRALDGDPKTTIMLASLGVCAVGLNLVAADTVILCDSWWAPAIEDQAVDRVHRLGQKKETTVWRLVMEGSVEERTLEVQKEKRELMALALREGPEDRKRREGGRGRSLRDIQRLLD